jgi:hypothetical protein
MNEELQWANEAMALLIIWAASTLIPGIIAVGAHYCENKDREMYWTAITVICSAVCGLLWVVRFLGFPGVRIAYNALFW